MHAGLISGLLWRRWRGNVPGIPGACTTRNFAYLVRGSWAYKSTGNWNVCSFDTYNKENFKVHITDFSERGSAGDCGLPSQMATDVESVFIPWPRHAWICAAVWISFSDHNATHTWKYTCTCLYTVNTIMHPTEYSWWLINDHKWVAGRDES